MTARTLSVHEDLGQVKYIFMDKTGTLTQNVMTFHCGAIDDTLYLAGASMAAAWYSSPLAPTPSPQLAATSHGSGRSSIATGLLYLRRSNAGTRDCRDSIIGSASRVGLPPMKASCGVGAALPLPGVTNDLLVTHKLDQWPSMLDPAEGLDSSHGSSDALPACDDRCRDGTCDAATVPPPPVQTPRDKCLDFATIMALCNEVVPTPAASITTGQSSHAHAIALGSPSSPHSASCTAKGSDDVTYATASPEEVSWQAPPGAGALAPYPAPARRAL